MAVNYSISLPKMMISTIFIVVLSLTPPAYSLSSQELDRALSALRFTGHALFANAVATSDLLFDLLSAESITLLCPTDSTLFSMDMTETLPFYISTLRLSSVPLRLALFDLRSLPNASSIPTLIPSHHLLLTRPSSASAIDDAIDLDGVRLLLPDLYTSRHIVVHGLAAALPFRYTAIASAPLERHRNPAPVTPGGSTVSPGPAPGPSGSNRTSRQSPPPSQDAYPRVLAPPPGTSRVDVYAPNGSPRISPDTAPEKAPGAVDRNTAKIGGFSLVQLAFLLGMNRGQEETQSEPLAMETSEF